MVGCVVEIGWLRLVGIGGLFGGVVVGLGCLD